MRQSKFMNEDRLTFVSRVDQMQEYLAQFQSSELDILCPECFATVRKTIVHDGYIVCGCDCYQRVFQPGAEAKIAALTTADWHQYITKSEGKACLDAVNRNDPIVNPALSPNYDIWCPGCERERKLAVKAVWLTRNKEYVCTYGVCAACMDRAQAMSDAQRDDFMDLVSDRLADRYLFLPKL
jgi:hypothetical protein